MHGIATPSAKCGHILDVRLGQMAGDIEFIALIMASLKTQNRMADKCTSRLYHYDVH